MDSGNSGSMQSSSGGDEEYDSRSDSISAFINSSTTPSSQTHNPSLFDPLSNFLDSFPRSPAPPAMNSVLNLDTAWNRGTDMGRGLMGSSSSTTPISVSDRSSFPIINNNNMNPSMQVPLGSENGGRLQASTDQQNLGRNPKKRSRASRRAPTTVLTTDTSNFRAMVQEFTGIPAPPFSSSAFPRARLDLFNTASSMRSALSNPPLPPYLLRPFAQKLQHQQQQQQLSTSIFGSLPLTTSSIPSTMVDAVNSTGNAATTANINTSNVSSTGTSATATTSTNSYQLAGDLGLLKQHPNLLNPSFAFQSPAPKYPFSSPTLPGFGAKSQAAQAIPSPGSHLRMGLLPLDEIAVNHGHVNTQLGTLTGLVGSDAISLRGNDPASWGDGVGSNYSNLQRVSSCKMNYSTGPSTDFHAEKGAENVSARGEGMVDSWICSTD
ncbi:hypothetical protein AAC387_Pa04g2973 [Persea americana]